MKPQISDEHAAAMLAIGDTFLEGIGTEEEVFAHLRFAFAEIADVFNQLSTHASATQIAMYSTHTLIVAALVRTIELGQHEQLSGAKLEEVLRANLRSCLKGAPVRVAAKPS